MRTYSDSFRTRFPLPSSSVGSMASGSLITISGIGVSEGSGAMNCSTVAGSGRSKNLAQLHHSRSLLDLRDLRSQSTILWVIDCLLDVHWLSQCHCATCGHIPILFELVFLFQVFR